jgi:hypothetical protein
VRRQAGESNCFLTCGDHFVALYGPLLLFGRQLQPARRGQEIARPRP